MLNLIKDYFLQLALIATLIFTFQIFFMDRSKKHNNIRIKQSLLFGISILLCMTFTAHMNFEFRMDLRIVPLLLGTLYGGSGAGLFLCGVIMLYRYYIGFDLGFYTTILTLLLSMPVFGFCHKLFLKANKNMRIWMSLILSIYYSLVGLTSITVLGHYSPKVLQVVLIHALITAVVVSFFVSLNEMIKETLRKNQQLQSEAKDAEIAFLRSQIKPHFLYNALNSIAALCTDEPHKAEKLTLDLSQVLRSGFDFRQLETLTTIENELELIRAYLNIEKARFGDRLQVKYEVSADLNTPIPPLILQPLVENAIRHGLLANLRGGTVKIVIFKKVAENAVCFAIEDDGCGMSKAKQMEIFKPDSTRKGIGLRNINQRIELIYGNSIQIESEEGKGTKVFFEIPV